MNIYKKDNLNTIVLLLIVYLAVNLKEWFPDIEHSTLFISISLLTAKGFYEIITRFIFIIISNTPVLMKMYWGKRYINGYWSYEYSREGKKYFGIWRISQDLNMTYVMGYGLNDDFSTRTIVRSVSPLIEDQGAFFVLNVRQELDQTSGFITPVYSKTTLIIDKPKSVFMQIETMRATTEIYGGSSNAHLHPNVIFRKHTEAKSDEDVIKDLKKIRSSVPNTTDILNPNKKERLT